MSPISSRNSVPPLACSKRPMRRSVAPVNAPFSWPNSSDSSSSAAIAEVFNATNGLLARGELSCNARATSSLPVPDSPVISTVMLERDSRPMALNTSCIAGAWPMIRGVGLLVVCCAVSRWRVRAARETSSTASSMSKGFGRYSNAPPWYADTALSRSECAVITMTGISGSVWPRRSMSSRPLMSGIRMSVIRTSGRSRSSAPKN